MTVDENLDFWPGFGVPLVDDLPDPLSPDDLRDEQMFETVEKIAEEIIRTGQVYDANQLLKKLQLLPGLERTDSVLYARYQPIWIAAKFLTLHTKKDEEIARLIQNHILDGLRSGIDIKEKLIAALMLKDVVASEGELPRKLQNALVRSEEKLGKESIKIRGHEYAQAPTVKNWVIDYNLHAGAKMGPYTARRGGLEKVSYVTQSENVRRLSREDRAVLSKLLELYDWLRYGPIGVEQLLLTNRFPISASKIEPRPLAPYPPRPVLTPEIPKPSLPPHGLSPRELIRENIESGISNIGERTSPNLSLERRGIKPPLPPRPQMPPPPRPPENRVQGLGSRVVPEPLVIRKSQPSPSLTPKPSPLSPKRILPPPPRPHYEKKNTEYRIQNTEKRTGDKAGNIQEALYRSTLEELHRMREEEKGLADSGQRTVKPQTVTAPPKATVPILNPTPSTLNPRVTKSYTPPPSRPNPPPRPLVTASEEKEINQIADKLQGKPSAQGFSVNDALARAGLKNTDVGSVVPGKQSEGHIGEEQIENNKSQKPNVQ